MAELEDRYEDNKNETPNRRKDFFGYRVDSYFSVCDSRICHTGVQMGRKKNKKEIKGFPGYDLHITIAIVIGLGILILMKACAQWLN